MADDLGPRGWSESEDVASDEAPPAALLDALPPPPRRRGRPRKQPSALALAAREASGEEPVAGPREWAAEIPEEGLHGELRRLLEHSEATDPRAREHASMMVRHYLESGDVALAPLGAEAARHGLTRFTLPPLIATLSSAVFELHHALLSGFFKRISALFDNGWEPIVVIRNHVYDETPSRIRVPEGDCLQKRRRRSEKSLPHVPEKADNKPRTAKVLQTDACLGVVMRHTESGDFHSAALPIPSCLQVLDFATADNLRVALGETWKVPGLESFMARFPLRLCSSTCDRAASNLKFERSVEDSCGQGDLHVNLHCNVHRIASVATAQNDLVAPDISNLISFGLCQRGVGMLRLLRLCVGQFMRARLKVYLGVHPPGPETPEGKHRAACLDLIFPGATDPSRRAVLEHYLNGDWQCIWEIQHVCPHGHCVSGSRESIADAFAEQVVPVMVPRLLHLFPRHRWTGAEVTLSDAGVLALPHRMLEQVGPVWLRCAQERRDPVAGDFAPSLGSDLVETERGWCDSEDEFCPEDVGEVPPANQTADAKGENEDWAAYNARMRVKTSRFFRSDPSSRIALIAIAMQPVSHLMHAGFKASSAEWERTQAARSTQGDQPKYRVVEASKLCPRFFEEVSELMFGLSDKSWAALGVNTHSLSLSTLAFRILSIAGGTCFALLESPSSGFPCRLFSLLDSGENFTELRESINQDRECALDSFTAGYRKHFADVGCPESLASLSLLCRMLFAGTAHIEARHSSVRRIQIHKSGTWTVNLETMNSYFTLLRHRRSHEVFGRPIFLKTSGTRPGRKAKLGKIAARRAQRSLPTWRQRKAANQGWVRSHGGGPWKVFQHRMLKGGPKPDRLRMRRLARQYRELSAEARAELETEGRRMTVAWRFGVAKPSWSFEPLPSDRGPCSLSEVALASAGAYRSSTLQARIEELRGMAVVRLAAEKLVKAQDISDLIKWQSDSQAKDVDRVAAFAPAGGRGYIADWPASWANHSSVTFPISRLAEEVLARGPGALKESLRQRWTDRQRVYRHAAAPPIGRLRRRTSASLCAQAGLCLHTVSGIRLAKFEVSFTKHMQGLFAPKTLERKALKKGFVVICISDGLVETWFHVAYCNMSAGSWRICLLLLVPDRLHDGEGHPPIDLIALRMPHGGTWEMTWRAFQHLKFDRPHSLRTFLVCGSAHVRRQTFQPFRIFVRPYLPEESFFWLQGNILQHSLKDVEQEAICDELLALQGQRMEEPGSVDGNADDADDASDTAGDDDDCEDPIDESELFDALFPCEPEARARRTAPRGGDAPSTAGGAPIDTGAPELPPRPPLAPPLAPAGLPEPERVVQIDRGSSLWLRFPIEGLGQIVWDDGIASGRNPSVAAHCNIRAHGLCRCNRTLQAGKPGSSRGRPLGFLVSWLRAGAQHADRASHARLASRKEFPTLSDGERDSLSLARRTEARGWMQHQPHLRDLLEAERPQWPGEGAEPLELPA